MLRCGTQVPIGAAPAPTPAPSSSTTLAALGWVAVGSVCFAALFVTGKEIGKILRGEA